MASGVKIFVFPVTDLARAKSFFGAFVDAEPAIDLPNYAAFKIGDQRLGLDPNGHNRGFSGSVGYWEVDDINAKLQELLDSGATEHEPVKDVGTGALMASVKDADGNIIGLIQPA